MKAVYADRTESDHHAVGVALTCLAFSSSDAGYSSLVVVPSVAWVLRVFLRSAAGPGESGYPSIPYICT